MGALRHHEEHAEHFFVQATQLQPPSCHYKLYLFMALSCSLALFIKTTLWQLNILMPVRLLAQF